MFRLLKKLLKYLLKLVCALLVLVLVLELLVIFLARSSIVPGEEAGQADCILVLGCGLKNGGPSPMLRDRLDRAIELYEAGASGTILVSGDDDGTYDEVTVMEGYCLAAGVPASAILADHSGFSTYDSVWRAKHVYGMERVILVTQRYHLYRAVYIAGALDLDAVGVASEGGDYAGQTLREAREVLARVKDLVKCMLRPPAEVTE